MDREHKDGEPTSGTGEQAENGVAGDPGSADHVDKILTILKEEYPNARSELKYRNNFELLIAVMLSAQTTDEAVNKVTASLFDDISSPQEMVELSQEDLEAYIKSIGLYRNKAKHVLATCRLLLDKHDGTVPGDYDDLIELPGVGRKTANVVLSNAFEEDAIAVDTHVFRVSHRLDWSDGSNPLQTERDLQEILPQDEWSQAHHLLIWHGRRVCDARSPECEECPLLPYCPEGAERTEST